MNNTDIEKLPIFKDLSISLIQQLLEAGQVLKLKKAESLCQKDEASDAVYILCQGELDILDVDKQGKLQKIQTFSAPFSIGELNYIAREKRLVNVVCHAACQVIKLDYTAIDAVLMRHPNEYHQFVRNISNMQQRLLLSSNQTTIQALQDRLKLLQRRAAETKALVGIILFLAIFPIVVNVIKASIKPNPLFHFILLPSLILVAFILLAVFIIKASGFSLQECGVNQKNLHQSLWESLGFTGLFIAAVTGLKYGLIAMGLMPHAVLFGGIFFTAAITTFKIPVELIVLGVVVYIALAPVQEFIVRGCIQRFFTDMFDHTQWPAVYGIVLSNALFAVSHVYSSNIFAFLVVIPGIFWGWLYYRHKSLVGVSVSHILIGIWVLYFLGTRIYLV